MPHSDGHLTADLHHLRQDQRDSDRLARQRRLLLFEQIERLARDFATEPAQIGRYLAEQENNGLLSTREHEALLHHLESCFGTSFLARVTRRGGHPATEAQGLAARIGHENRATATATRALVEDLARRLDLPANRVDVRADDDARRRTGARGARGLMDAGRVYLDPDSFDPTTREGRALLAHEMTHVAQLGGPGDKVPGRVSRPAAEAEAARIGQAFGAGEAFDLPAQSLPPQAIAADTGAAESHDTALEPPTHVKLNLGGRTLTLPIPAGPQAPAVQILINETLFDGLFMTRARLQFDDQWRLSGGELLVDIRSGDHILMRGVTLAIDRGGNVETHLRDIPFQAAGLLDGEIDLVIGTRGISGRATLTAEQLTLSEQLSLTEGHLSVTLDENGSLSGQGELRAEIAEVGTLVIAAAFLDDSLSGSATLQLAEPIQVSDEVFLEAASVGGEYHRDAGSVELTGDVRLAVRDSFAASISGHYEFPGDNWSMRGTLAQTGELVLDEMRLSDGELSVAITKGVLEEVEANALVTMPSFELSVGCRYDLAANHLTGKGQIELTDELELQRAGVLLKALMGEVEIDQNRLTRIQATDLLFELHDREGALLEGWLNGAAIAADESDGWAVSGEAALRTARDLRYPGATRDGEADLIFVVREGSGLGAAMEEGELQTVEAEIVLAVEDHEGEFMSAALNTELDPRGEHIFEGSGEIEVTREKLWLGTEDGLLLYLEPGSGGRACFHDNSLAELGGTIRVRLEDLDGPLVRVALTADYDEAGGMSGTGAVDLLRELHVADVGEYSLFVEPGSGAHATLEGDEVSRVGGQVTLRLDDSEGALIEIKARADYDIPGERLSGTGTAEVLRAQLLAEFAGQRLFLCAGAGAEATVSDNRLQNVGGAIKLRLDDEQGTYLMIDLAGTFDAAGGTGFTGAGDATVTRATRLSELDGYEFWLAEGIGATAHIEQNAIDKVTGRVPFMVRDGHPTPLIVGHATGVYEATSKEFSGEGEVRLGRDVDFELSGTSKIRFLEDSGGRGTVTANELDRLAGTLSLELFADGQPLVGITGEGRYDAVRNKIVKASGIATIVRPFELLDGQVVLSEITGTATVEDNLLVEAGGSGKIVVLPLHEMAGTFEVCWSNRGDGDKYSGRGELDFTLLDDPAKDRSMTGTVAVEYNEDDTLNIEGEIDYQMNKVLGGKLGVQVDQTLNPTLSGEIRATDVEIIEGRDLFALKQQLFAVNQTFAAGPVPVAVGLGAMAGMKLSMDPLLLTAAVAIENFRPMETSVPEFTTTADLDTGLTFRAALVPYFSMGLGAGGVASAGLALQGEVALLADLGLAPQALLRGDERGFSGELSVGLEVVGNADLILTPQLYAELMGKRWPYDIETWSIPLGELFSYTWSATYSWGDEPQAPKEGAAPPKRKTAAGATRATAGATAPPSLSEYDAAHDPGPTEGGPTLPGPSELAAAAAAGEGGGMGELQQKMDEAREIAEKIGSIAGAAGELVTPLSMITTIPPPFGLAGAGLYLAYLHISRELTIEDIVQMFRDMWDLAMRFGLMDYVRGLLPEWALALWEQIKGKSARRLIGELLVMVRNWLVARFPSWRKVAYAVVRELNKAWETFGRLVRDMQQGMSLDEFLELAVSLGQKVAQVIADVAAQLGEWALERVKDVADRLGSAGRWLSGQVGSLLASLWGILAFWA